MVENRPGGKRRGSEYDELSYKEADLSRLLKRMDKGDVLPNDAENKQGMLNDINHRRQELGFVVWKEDLKDFRKSVPEEGEGESSEAAVA